MAAGFIEEADCLNISQTHNLHNSSVILYQLSY